MINQEIKQMMKKTIDFALDQGVGACDVIVSRGDSLDLKAQNGKIDKYNLSNSQVFGIRIIEDKRVGIAFSESTDEKSLYETVKMARENAKTSDENPYETIEGIALEHIVENDPHLLQKDETTQDEKINLALKLESEVKEREPRVTAVPYGGVGESAYQYYYMNSPGSFCFQEERYVTCSTSALIKDGSDTSMHYHSSVARSFDSLDWEVCVEESLYHATKWLHGQAIQSGHYDVVFTPDAFGSLLSCFGNIFSAKAAKDKVNPMAEKLGSQIANKDFTIIDSPIFHQSFVQSIFDDEGFKREDLPLIQNGVLTNFYHNTATAKYFGVKTNARASRSAKSSLGIGGTTKVIKTGKTTDHDLFDGTILEIHSMDGLHSGTNSMSGDFSLGCHGYLKKNGEIIQSVKGITVAGNFYKMINQMVGIGHLLKHNASKTFFTPLIRFEGLSIAGK